MNNALYDRLLALPIADLAPVFDNGVRGRTMSSSSCSWLLPKVREAGVKTAIDLRTADHTDKFCKKVHDAGLAYRHIAIDSKNTDVREIIASLFDFFAWLDEGPYDCVPELWGHRKNGVLRCDDIARRLNSIMSALTPNDNNRMGLPDDYRDEFNRRKKHLFAVNSIF